MFDLHFLFHSHQSRRWSCSSTLTSVAQQMWHRKRATQHWNAQKLSASADWMSQPGHETLDFYPPNCHQVYFFLQSWCRTFAKLLGWLCWSLSKHVCLTRCVSSKADASTNPLGEKLRYPPFINMDATWVKCICGVGQVWPWMFVMCECQRDDAASINIRCRCIMSQSCKDCIRHLNHPH